MSEPANSLYSYFAGCSPITTNTVGAEIETSFVTADGNAISVETSQAIFQALVEDGWHIVERKGILITKIQNVLGDTLLYELGRQNIELSTTPRQRFALIPHTRSLLQEIYASARKYGAIPYFAPILNTPEDLLVIPDKRDATWLKLDGRESLRPLAAITAVQFTFGTTPAQAIDLLNRLGKQLPLFLEDYPQDSVWREYIKSSNAHYRADRYGGPLIFSDLRDYCEKLLLHDVVNGNQLTAASELESFSIPLFLRSVWWYFRLRRYGDQLCVEVRPIPRRTDEELNRQFNMVLEILE